jgi:propanediol utilization protein
MRVPIWVSNRHVHLSQIDAQKLFGKWYEMKLLKNLSQPWQFSCEETISIKWPKWQIDKVRILWPYRKETQVEIMAWDNYVLWIKAPLKMSGDLEWSEAITLVGPKWSVYISKWVIVAQRHIHMSVAQAKDFGFKNNQIVSVKIKWDRWLVFENVKIRTNDSFDLDFHIDVEEGNAAWVKFGDRWEII